MHLLTDSDSESLVVQSHQLEFRVAVEKGMLTPRASESFYFEWSIFTDPVDIDGPEGDEQPMMRKYATRSRWFMDAYDCGLNGIQAAWAARKYRGHRALPQNILDELEKEGII